MSAGGVESSRPPVNLLSPPSDAFLPIQTSMLDEVQSHPTGLKPHSTDSRVTQLVSMQPNSMPTLFVGGAMVDSDTDVQTDCHRVKPGTQVTWSNTIRVCLFTSIKCRTARRAVDSDSDVDSGQDNDYTPLHESDGHDAPMATGSYTSRSAKRSKEKFRWTQVNAGDVRSNAL